MDSTISIGHPFYFPTQVVLVDDDPDFLEGISMMLKKDLSFKLFHSASSALDYVNEGHTHVNILQRCYTSYKTGPQESDALSHIDIGKIHLEVLNGFRFQTCSTVVVDYSMPEMNGLEFLREMKNPFIKKVLLTGQADMELAIKAFNQQLIDQFIDKHDPRLKQKLNSTVSSFQEQYFRSSFKLITDPIIANNTDGFLVSKEFQEFFEHLRKQIGCIEYYMLDFPHSGFLMLDELGRRQCLLIYTQASLEEHWQELRHIGAPQQLLSLLSEGEVIPVYDTQAVPLSLEHPAITNWNDFYFPAKRIQSRNTAYYTSMTDDSLLPDIHGVTLHSYKDFLDTNSMTDQIVH